MQKVMLTYAQLAAIEAIVGDIETITISQDIFGISTVEFLLDGKESVILNPDGEEEEE